MASGWTWEEMMAHLTAVCSSSSVAFLKANPTGAIFIIQKLFVFNDYF